MILNKKNYDKEQSEGLRLEVFIDLFNKKYHTDYEIGPVEIQNSIVDRKAISSSKKWKELKIQLKDVKEFDIRPFTKNIMSEGSRVFDLNIFRLLTPFLKKIEDDYGTSADGVILVLDVGVSETWLKDFEVPEIVKKMNFDGIYCFSSLIQNFIFPLKEINL